MDNCIRQANCSWNSKVHPVASAHGIEDETKIALNGHFTELPRPRKRRGETTLPSFLPISCKNAFYADVSMH